MKITPFSLSLLLSALVLSLPAMAQDAVQEASPPPQPTSIVEQPADMGQTTDILPVKAASESDVVVDEDSPTHPTVKLTPDKSELIRLGTKASTVLVGNPAHLNIVPEGADTLVLVPRSPGATYFTVLDENNKVIMQRHVIVASPKEKYVRVRKSCAGSDKNCQPTQVYYCPDMCHEIILNAGVDDKNKSKSNDSGNDDSGTVADAGTGGHGDGEETTKE